jgi:LemA protein
MRARPVVGSVGKLPRSQIQREFLGGRAGLIPNLVAAVQDYAKQECEVLTTVVDARAKATQIKVDASQLTDPEKLKQFHDTQNQLSSA